MGIADEIERLAELHRHGSMTEEEFTQAKAAVLANAQSAPPVADNPVADKPVEPLLTADAPFPTFSPPAESGGSKCFKCPSPPVRSCTLCGRMFCNLHGGDRWVWVSHAGGRSGSGNVLTSRVACDACASKKTSKRNVQLGIVGFMVFFVLIILFFLNIIGFFS